MTSPGTARRLWAMGEPFHALTYFTDECRTAAEATGLRGFWRTYFALRAAPLGPVGPAVVTAAFYNFAPAFVARRVPEVWAVADPATVLEARLAGVDAAVRRVLGEQWPRSAAAAEAADLLVTAAAAVDAPGRPLAAANAALPVPGEPHLAAWQSLTTLREHRGDGHNAALLQRGISGVGAHVLAAAAGRTPREWLVRARGWDDAAWDAAVEQLAPRGWLDGGELTAEGAAIVAAVEADTDRLALGPWRALGDTGCDRLAELLGPVRRAVVGAGAWPAGNPIGVPEPG
ncbi:hypothetical protein [Geodermatophilus sp. DSM 45219]|uniref:SCO6745 family protein n=1 Tax=Geodermatophilus sp. DSM 45219 TaxID=1881103 RepID=UPI00088E3B59|nr:hypothetical protein [Geodermatophilus sp. DSM 45219]SDO14684.1 hypothetical protein SAMN05428965_2854 [Geodermatophilus sp. DSM 45219]